MINLTVQIHDPSFKVLESTLQTWLHVIREYTYRVPKDLKDPDSKDYCWWYKERPQVGFLSIAAWLNGWAALEEWGTRKKDSHGRNDLWIGRGDSQFYIEAKYGHCYLEYGEVQINQDIKNHVRVAEDSTDKLEEDPAGKRVAAAFISPSWRQTEKNNFEKIREFWIQQINSYEATGAGASALIAPDWEECARDEAKHRWMGSALLLAEVK